MRLFYVNGEAQVTMPLDEFTDALKESRSSTPVITSTATVNGSKTRAVRVGRKRVGGRTGERIRKTARRMVARRTMSTADVKRRRAGLMKARAVLAANRKKAKAQRRQPKRDWGPIIAKRNATLAAKHQAAQPTADQQQPMAEAQ